MLKKLLILGVAIIMLFSLAACEEDKKMPVTETDFYQLQEAYYNGWIKREEIMHIVYFMDGEVLEAKNENEDGTKVDFVPQMEKPTLDSLDSKVADDMKNAFYEKHQDDFERAENVIEDITITNFLGEYNGF